MALKSLTPPKLTLDGVLKHWPFPEKKPRDLQIAALEKAILHYNNGAQYVVLEVPVGGGKSFIGMTLAAAMGDSFMLTLTQQLQSQYVKDFEGRGASPLFGRAKFTCTRHNDPAFTCADGRLEYTGKDKCGPDICPYQLAKMRAFESQHIVANYHSFYFNVGLAAELKKTDPDAMTNIRRALTVMDECHAAEMFLLEQESLSIRTDKFTFKLAPLPREQDTDNVQPEPYFAWLREELVPKLDEYVTTMKKRGILDPKTEDELASVRGRAASVLRTIPDPKAEQNPADLVEWVAERETARDGKSIDPSRFTLKPLFVNRWGRRLTGFSDRVLLMSGTVLSAYHVVSALGLDPSKGEFESFDSPFPAENRPVYLDNLDMSHKSRDESWPLMLKKVEALLNAHAGQKGILLAASNKMLEYIVKGLPPNLSRRILVATGKDRMVKYNEHCNSPSPTVLGASGFWEGADLKGKLSEFQIIPQLPRPMWQGQVKKRAERDGRWYDMQTMMKVLQGLGRSIRNETDAAPTYVFDSGFRKELKRGDKSFVPLWVKTGVVYVDVKNGQPVFTPWNP
jgi:ATP-dependent DNA helicase DinG